MYRIIVKLEDVLPPVRVGVRQTEPTPELAIEAKGRTVLDVIDKVLRHLHTERAAIVAPTPIVTRPDLDDDIEDED